LFSPFVVIFSNLFCSISSIGKSTYRQAGRQKPGRESAGEKAIIKVGKEVVPCVCAFADRRKMREQRNSSECKLHLRKIEHRSAIQEKF
jgi:hypothetical protein